MRRRVICHESCLHTITNVATIAVTHMFDSHGRQHYTGHNPDEADVLVDHVAVYVYKEYFTPWYDAVEGNRLCFR